MSSEDSELSLATDIADAVAAVVQPGEVVLTECLTDHGIIGLANVLGFTLRGLPIDREGILVEAFEETCAAGGVAALVLVPTLGNPTSHVMSAQRRQAIADVARRHGVFVVEDDDDACVIKTDTTRVNNLFRDLEKAYGTLTGGKDNKVFSLKTFTKAISIINLIKSTWSIITTQDDIVGNAIEDVVAKEFHPGANWIVKGVGSVTTGVLRLEMK